MQREIVEQYLRIIYNLTEGGGAAKTTEIAGLVGVAPASVTEMLHKLDRSGLVKHESYKGVVLTGKGRRIARKIARKHRLLERFLSDVVGLTGRSRHEQACKMEHALSDEAEHSLCKMMNHPQECPHGRSIPKCDRKISCEKCTDSSTSLDTMNEGETGIVTHLACGDRDDLCEMLAIGFVPGTSVTLEKKVPLGGPLIVNLRGTKIAIARDRGKLLHLSKAG